jgi:photosynthetic reaction center cytochrome c subunit
MRTKSFSIVAAACLVLAVAVLFVSSSTAQQPESAVRTAGQQYKNIQILSAIPADQVLPTMRFFNYSLGVDCEFCHVDGDESKDDKDNKKMARTMMQMEMGINKDNFKGRTEVTCSTCHHGTNDPVSVPLVPESTMISMAGKVPAATPGAPPPAAPAVAAAPALPSADAILAKYVDALGGEQALRKMTSRVVSGTRDTAARNTQPTVPPTRGPFESYEQAPNRSAMVVHTPNGQATASGFDGTAAWAQDARGRVTEASGTDLARAARSADFYAPLNIKQAYARLVVRGVDKVGDRDVYVMFGVPQGDTGERLSFDQQTGLLLRKTMRTHNAMGDNALQIDYQDYKEAGGVKYPSTIRIADLGANPPYVVLHLDKVDVNVPVDDSKLAKPESKPQPPPAAR